MQGRNAPATQQQPADDAHWFTLALPHFFVHALALAMLALLLAGCGEPLANQPQPLAPGETWHAMYMRGKKVGVTHTTVEEIAENGKTLIKQQAASTLQVSRFGVPTTQQMTLLCVADPQGSVVRLKTLHTAAGMENLSEAQRIGNQLQITVRTQGKESTTSIPWSDNIRGYFGIENSLLRQPMQPGEKRSLKIFAPLVNQVLDVTLEAKDRQLVDLLDGQAQNLLRVEATTITPGAGGEATEMKSIYWVDDRGEPLRVRSEAMEQETFRVPEEIALQPAEESFDIGEDSVVALAVSGRPIRDRDSASYVVKINGGEAAKLFRAAVYQDVAPLDAQTARVTVRNVTPDDIPAGMGTATLAPADLEPNNLVQSDNPAIQAMAAQVLPGERNVWKLAKALEQYVADTVEATNLTQAVASAAEVAESKQGDCTEHAVLLAALCRARGIPARVVVGLVYVPSLGGFGYHMWNEVAAGEHWLPLDATRPNETFAGHLKLLDTNLAGANAYSSFLPVFQVMGRLEISLAE